MITSKFEFLVDWGVNGDRVIGKKIVDELKQLDDIEKVEIKDDSVIVESTMPSSKLLQKIEEISNRRTVLQGIGDKQSAVAQMSGCCGEIGVVRLSQAGDGLVIDGTVDGLTEGEHGLRVHEAGDLSEGCKSIGDIYGGPGGKGELGVITADDSGRSVFRFIHRGLTLSEIIGRSLAITASPQADSKKINWADIKTVCCGIIARSAGVLRNPKRVCLCDGVVVWEERAAPLAGGARTSRCQHCSL